MGEVRLYDIEWSRRLLDGPARPLPGEPPWEELLHPELREPQYREKGTGR